MSIRCLFQSLLISMVALFTLLVASVTLAHAKLPEFGDPDFPRTPDSLALLGQDLPMNPHGMPRLGPWFEGWYYRISDPDNGRSFAVIGATTLVQGQASQNQELPGYLAVLISDGTGTVTVHEIFPEKTSITRGASPIEFEWRANSYGVITQDRIELTLPDRLTLKAQFGARKPWNTQSDAWGPEGYGTFMTFLPLHWFVHSLGSEARYELTLATKPGAPKNTLTGRGYGHMEKNWGKAFPKAWMWTEGVSENGDAALAAAGGRVDFGSSASASMTTWLVGYRSPKVEADFQAGQAMDTEFTTWMDACQGTFELRAKNTEHILHLVAQADPRSFGKVSIPTAAGYQRNGGMESFTATIDVEILRNDWISHFLADRVIEKRQFRNAALEFGAEYMNCPAR